MGRKATGAKFRVNMPASCRREQDKIFPAILRNSFFALYEFFIKKIKGGDMKKKRIKIN
jgi:hypothetical protein